MEREEETVTVLRDGKEGTEMPREKETEMKKDQREEKTSQTPLCASHFNSHLLPPRDTYLTLAPISNDEYNLYSREAYEIKDTALR